MKVHELQRDWSIDNLTLCERPDPLSPGPRQVLLRMRAASLNYRDLIVARRGYGPMTGTLPLVPVSDGVGTVIAVGDQVSRFAKGDRVCPMFFPNWIAGPPRKECVGALGGPIDGVMAELMLVDEQAAAAPPNHLTDEEAATLPCAALTAWSALVTEGRLRAGQTVLVQGTGGVSLFALQFAKLMGVRVIVTSSTDDKLARARELGADICINYRTTPEWGKLARAQAGGEGIDLVVEVGGAGTMQQSLRAIRTGGTICIIGVLSGVNAELPLGLCVARYARLQSIGVGNRDGFDAMARAISQHKVRPVIDRVFPFEELRPALDYLAAGRHVGKICVKHPA